MTTKILDTLLLPKLTPEVKTFFGLSSVIKMGLRNTSPDVKKRIETFLSEPVFTMSDLDKKYRTINYLEETKLIDDTRDNKGKGWRKLGLAEYIYISLLLELRKYGLKATHLKNFKALYDESFTYSLFAVLAGHEVILVVKPDGFCALLDPTFMSIYEEEDSRFSTIVPIRNSGEIQLKVSYFINHALSIINKPNAEIHYSSVKSVNMSSELMQLKDYEKKLLEKVEQLDSVRDERLVIKRLKDDSILLKYSEYLPNDSDFVSQLSTLVDEDFCDLTFVKRDGKAANLELTRTEKLSIL